MPISNQLLVSHVTTHQAGLPFTTPLVPGEAGRTRLVRQLLRPPSGQKGRTKVASNSGLERKGNDSRDILKEELISANIY